MISHERKFIFIHVPKTAGCSIISQLGNPKGGRHPSWGHRRLSSTLENNSECAGYLKFTFVRNPWDRAVSAFHYMQKGGAHNKWDNKDHKKYFNKPQSFQEFIKSDNFNTVVINQQHFKAMTYYLDGGFDFIGRFENLQGDFDTMCDKIGMPKQTLPHKNKSNHKHFTEYYDNETKQIVAEKYAKDIEVFGYGFGD